MAHEGKDIPLCQSLAGKISAHDLGLAQNLHRLELLLVLLLHQLHLPEAALTQDSVSHEVLRTHLGRLGRLESTVLVFLRTHRSGVKLFLRNVVLLAAAFVTLFLSGDKLSFTISPRVPGVPQIPVFLRLGLQVLLSLLPYVPPGLLGLVVLQQLLLTLLQQELILVALLLAGAVGVRVHLFLGSTYGSLLSRLLTTDAVDDVAFVLELLAEGVDFVVGSVGALVGLGAAGVLGLSAGCQVGGGGVGLLEGVQSVKRGDARVGITAAFFLHLFRFLQFLTRAAAVELLVTGLPAFIAGVDPRFLLWILFGPNGVQDFVDALVQVEADVG